MKLNSNSASTSPKQGSPGIKEPPEELIAPMGPMVIAPPQALVPNWDWEKNCSVPPSVLLGG